MLRTILLRLIQILPFISVSNSIIALDDPIEIASGLVSGSKNEFGIRVYKGIPFAAPPVDELRWKPPEQAIPWTGVLNATEFGTVSPQTIGSSEAADESSLFLNIWTPATEEQDKLPVMIWFHGGAWTGGSGSMPIFDGTEFAKKGVVLVTANYRLGVLGFLAHPALSSESDLGVSGNYGLLDNLATLNWVQENIAAFGGDPNNVTVFGESAGATSIYLLLTSPHSKDLFHKAIVQSAWASTTNITYLEQGTAFSPSAEEIGKAAIDEYFRSIGVSDNASSEFSDTELLAMMRSIPVEDTLNISLTETAAVDGWLLPELPSTAVKEGLIHPIPIIAGINNGEGTFFARSNSFESATQQRSERSIQFGADAPKLLEFYGATSTDDIQRAEADYLTDEWFARPARELLRAAAANGTPAFQYYFIRNRFSPSAAAPHVAEVPYVFKFLNPEYSKLEDLALANIINDYWVQFAKNGNPNSDNHPNWRSFDLETESYQVLDVQISSDSQLHKQRLDALESYLDRVAQNADKLLTGEWTVAVTVLGEYAGDSKITLTTSEGGILNGTYSGQLLNGPFEGIYSNEGFEFSFESDIGMSLTFKGSLLANGQIEGTMESMGRVLGSFSGKKPE